MQRDKDNVGRVTSLVSPSMWTLNTSLGRISIAKRKCAIKSNLKCDSVSRIMGFYSHATLKVI